MDALRAISTEVLGLRAPRCARAPVATFVVLLTLCLPVGALARPGDLDRSFGEDGYARVQANMSCVSHCVEFGGSYGATLARQPDGGLVLGGYNAYLGAPRGPRSAPGAIVRLTPNGALDTTFGVGGIDYTPFRVADIHTNAAGGLLVYGEAATGRLASQRYTASGLLDGSYGSQGLKLGPRVAGLLRGANGRYLSFVTLRVPPSFTAPSTTRLDVTRLLPSGDRDMRFGRHGYVQLLGSKGNTPVSLAAEPDGGLIAVFERGWLDSPPRFSQLFIEHVTPAGQVDRGFGRRGIVRMRLNGVASEAIVAVRHGHVLLAVGETRATQAPALEGEEDLVLADYTDSGRLDRRFGVGGTTRSKFPTGTRYGGVSPRLAAFDARGDLIVVGEHRIRTVDTPAGEGFIARYTPRGRDCSFGTRGIVIDAGIGVANAFVVQPDGRIVVAGGLRRFVAARYIGGGGPRTCAREGNT
jgi:uncharacterized delta-60 repeat protein